eukprot:TRINITY_DN61451_c0_g1_i2.p1 TRINITY_DN61451_c0_g1~~TRINITY_DN61451_c0_g1_i2.p1  ORF type:complete len:227 (+),score=83.76 TRINITY_DN61451_c0_g1_i2:25-681(+)
MEAQDWLELYENAVYRCRQVGNAGRSRTSQTVKQKRQRSRDLNQLQQDLTRLERSFREIESDPGRYGLGQGELSRRRGLLQRLRADVMDIGSDGRNTRAGLFNSRKAREEAQETDDTEFLTNAQLHQQQQVAMDDQDQHLDRILDGVSVLKNMSHDIGAELDVHSQLLEELDEAVEVTDNRVQSNTHKVTDVHEKTGGCLPLCIIFLLFAVIIALIVV